MKKLMLILLTFGIIFTYIGCNKPKLIGKFLLTDEIKAQNPFHVGENVNFNSDSGKLFSFSCYLRQDTLMKMICCINSNDYYYIEQDVTVFKIINDSNSTSSFQLGMYMYNNDPLYDIYFSNKKIGVGFFRFHLPLSKETSDFIDSIQVLGKWYYNIYTAESGKDEKISKLYYSTEYGIVKIDFPDSSYWDLKNINW